MVHANQDLNSAHFWKDVLNYILRDALMAHANHTTLIALTTPEEFVLQDLLCALMVSAEQVALDFDTLVVLLINAQMDLAHQLTLHAFAQITQQRLRASMEAALLLELLALTKHQHSLHQ